MHRDDGGCGFGGRGWGGFVFGGFACVLYQGKTADGLPLALIVELKIVFRQVADGAAGGVAHNHRDKHDIYFGSKRCGVFGRWSLRHRKHAVVTIVAGGGGNHGSTNGCLIGLEVEMRLTVLFLAAASLVAQTPEPGDARGWMNRGVQAYRNAQYAEAVEDFRRAIEIDPSNMNARLYLATAYMTMYVPGVDSPENRDHAERTRAEFLRVLELNPNDKTALASLASLSYQEAQGLANRDDKVRKLDESRDWNQKLLAVDPQNKEAYYTLAVIDWVKWYPAYMEARAQLGMGVKDPGPFPDGDVRRRLEAEYGQVLEDGIANLNKALAIDPEYDDAMAYMNLLIRQRADLRLTKDEYKQDIAEADRWVERSFEAKRAKAITPPPQARNDISRYRFSGNLQSATLVHKVDPVYPPLAKQARVQGTVRFTAIIGKNGSVSNLQLVSGHPLLVAAAQEAVKKWVYRPTLLNGEPVEVVTQIDVPFSLPQ